MAPQEQNKRWQAFHVFTAKLEKKYRPVIYRALQDQIQQFLDYAKRHTFPDAVASINHVVTIEPVAKAVKPLHREAAVKWGYATYKEYKSLKATANDVQSDLLDFIDQYFQLYFYNKGVLPITETTKEWIRQQVAEGLSEGLGYDEIAKNIADKSEEVNKLRALRIVRTETVRAANAGSIEGAKKTGLVMQKIWISAQDSRTRRLPRDSYDHLNMNGVVVNMDDYFPVPGKKGTQMLAFPGDPSADGGNTINCRCTVGFIPVRDERGRVQRTAA